MNYKKKYKDALKSIKELYSKGSMVVVSKEEFEAIFPELKENEKIRKAIIRLVEINKECMINNIASDSMLTWLEKQGEQKRTDKVEPKFKNGKWIVWQDKCYKVNDNGCGYELVDQNGLSTSLEYGTVDENAHIYDITKDAKPGDVIYLPNGNNEYYFFIFKGIENAAVNSFAYFYQYNDGTFEVKGTIDNLSSVNDVFQPATKEQRDLLFQKMKENNWEWDEDKKEMKNIAKFKVGDWCIDNEDGVIFQIVKVLDNTYTYKTNEGKEYSCTHYSLENDTKPWTIQDAKDGDILATENFIFIFKNIDNGNGIHYYCHYEINKHEDDNQFGIALPQSLMGRVGDVISHYTPATKEQCSILFQEMKENNWEWDEDKKELRKINNALEECEIEHIEHGKYYYCIKDYYSGGRKRVSKGEVVQALRGMSMMALGVKANEYFIPVKCIVGIQPAWSEEDKRMVGTLIAIFEVNYPDGFYKVNPIGITDMQGIHSTGIIKWLKSIKQRMEQ